MFPCTKTTSTFPVLLTVESRVENCNIPRNGTVHNSAYRTHMQIQEPFRLEEFACSCAHTNTTHKKLFGSFYTHKQQSYSKLLFALQKNGMTISWKHIEALFLMETTTSTPGVRLAHKLTRDHICMAEFIFKDEGVLGSPGICIPT